MGKRPIVRRFTNNQSELCGSKRDISLRPQWQQPPVFIRRWAFCQLRGGSCPKHHIRRNVCLLRWPRKGGSRGTAKGSGDRDETRGKPRQEPPPRFLQLQTSAAPAATRSLYPLPPQFALKGTLIYTFISPFHVGSERMHLGGVSTRGFFFLTLFKVSAPFPVLLANSCSTLWTAFN